ncbi:MAG: DUF3108 domain-containing protein [Bacteroidales bacterium]|nr:DUF3108 domain-containing protein [Bacteroidales bacterium]
MIIINKNIPTKSSNKTALILIAFCFINAFSKAQCFDTNTTFNVGEKITYEVAYNWGFLWVNAGEVFFKVDSVVKNNKHLYHFKSMGETYKFYDWFFKVKDNYESYVEIKTLKPLNFIRDTYEGGFTVNNKYIFDHDNKLIYTFTQNSDKAYTEDTLKFPDCTFDVLSAVYYTRNIDFSKYCIGDKIPISFIIDNEIYELYIRYLGEEIIENRDKQKYKCIKFKAMLVEGTIFSGGENLTVWVTNDKNKIPVFAEAKILIGYVKAYLTSFEGLKHEMTSKINE